MEPVLQVYRNDEIGARIGTIRMKNAIRTIELRFDAQDLRVSRKTFDVIILKNPPRSDVNLEIVDPKNGRIIRKIAFSIRHFANRDRPAIEIERIENSQDTDLGAYGNIIRRISEGEDQDEYVFFEDSKVVLLAAKHAANSTTQCAAQVFLIHPPTQITPECGKPLDIESQTDIVVSNPPIITILDRTSDDVRFASAAILMLVSSVHSIDATFGRVTAESAFNISYYLVGTSSVSIDSQTGELFLRRRFYRDLTDLQIVAVVESGIAIAKLTIEVIEDRIHLARSNFVVFAPPTMQIGMMIGEIDLGRSDVMLDLIDDYFYTRKSQLFVKRLLSTNSQFYDLEGIVKKGKLSREIKITVVFASNRWRLNDDEIAYFVEENLRVGSVIGSIAPNNNSIKYRMIDESAIRIDQHGLIRTTRMFDREKEALIKATMIEIGGSKIWKMLIFVDDVNDNPPFIPNTPSFLRISRKSHFVYQFLANDLDDSKFHWHILNGDPYESLGISDNGTLFVKSEENLKHLEKQIVVRVFDGFPPFNYHFTDITVPIQIEEVSNIGCQNDTFWVFGDMPKVGDTIGTVKGAGGARQTFRIIPQSDPFSQFSINPMDGEVFLEKEVEDNQFDLTIQVRSFDATEVESCNLQIRFAYIRQKSMDSRLSGPFEVRLSEGLPIGSRIAKIEKEGNAESTIYRIEGGDTNFTISPFDGALYLSTPLDFEDIQEYSINVSLVEFGGDRVVDNRRIKILVENENDESPRFITGDVIHLSIDEELDAASFPMIIGTSLADDLDSPILTYSIVFGNTSLFSINETSGAILSLQPVDRELQDSYELIIEAKDSGATAVNTATCKISISLNDINDNAPQFEQSFYSIKIPENLAINSKILKVSAADRDIGENGRISYVLEGDTKGMIFRIDPKTGWIYTNSIIDRETSEKFLIFVEAIDNGTPPLNSSVAVEILIEDVNDNPPEILDTNYDIFVSNELSEGDIIYAIDVLDADLNDTLTFSISGRDHRFFSIDSFGIIRLTNNRLTTNSFFSIRVKVSDQVGHWASANYTFYLHPSKEFPEWVESIESAIVNENQKQTVALFQAFSQFNSTIRYSIVSPCKPYFDIGETTGILETRSSLDFERFQKCPIIVVATSYIDSKELSIRTECLVEVRDLNDNQPRFEKQLYHFNVSENAGPVTIGFVKAIDEDEMGKAKLEYRIIEGDPLSQFLISDTGAIEAVSDLDREQIPNYLLIIQASDQAHSSNCSVRVTVVDEDDNPPRFSRIFHSELPEDAPIGTFVIELSASDADQIHEHRFSIEALDSAQLPFFVEENSGRVYTNSSLDYEKKSTYRAKIRLTDGSWSIETSLFVRILDKNDNAPIFREKYVFFVSASSPIGTVIADDADETGDPNGMVRYSIIANSNYEIDPQNGQISQIRNIDVAWESVGVEAHDLGIPRQSTNTEVFMIREDQWNKKEYRVAKSSSEIGVKITNPARILIHPLSAARLDQFANVIREPNASNFKILHFDTLEIWDFSIVEDPKESGNVQMMQIDVCKSLNIGAVLGNISTVECSEFEPIQSPILLDRDGILKSLGVEENSQVLNGSCNDQVLPKGWRRFELPIRFLDCSTVPPKIQSKKTEIPEAIEISQPAGLPEGSIVGRVPPGVDLVGVNGPYIKNTQNLTLDSDFFSRDDRKLSKIRIHSNPAPILFCSAVFDKQFYEFSGFSANLSLDLGVPADSTCHLTVDGPFVVSKDFRIVPKAMLIPRTYQVSVFLKDLYAIRSTAIVAIHILPPVTTPSIPRVIFARQFGARPINVGELLDDELQINGRGLIKVPIRGNELRIVNDELELGNDSTIHVASFDQRLFHVDVAPFDHRKCIQQATEAYQISESCRLSTTYPINETFLNLKSVNENQLKNLTIHIRNWETKKTRGRSNVQIEFYGKQSAIFRLWQDLQEYYEDMRIIAISASIIIPDFRYTFTISIIDRNGQTLTSSECRRTIGAFLDRQHPGYLEMIDILDNPCASLVCRESETCQPSIVSEDEKGIASRYGDRILNLRQGILGATCQTMRLDCGKGGKADEQQRICHCYSGGFVSKESCDMENDPFSLSDSKMSISIRNPLKLLENSPNCSSQQLEIDFQTTSSLNDIIFHVESTSHKIVVLVEKGHIKMELLDGMRKIIVVQLDKRVDDGSWHRISFAIENDRRKMSIQIDGRGKEVKTRFDLPLLFEGIVVLGRSKACLKRLIVHNQLVTPKVHFEEINLSISGEIKDYCPSVPSTHLGFLADLNTYILVVILLIILVISLTIGLVTMCQSRRKEEEKWEKASEIDAYQIGHRARNGSVNENEHEVYVINPRNQGVINMAYL